MGKPSKQTLAAIATTTRAMNHHRYGWIDHPTITAGEARRLIGRREGQGNLDAPSKVNKQLSVSRALKILRTGVDPLEDAAPIEPLVFQNVIWECGQP